MIGFLKRLLRRGPQQDTFNRISRGYIDPYEDLEKLPAEVQAPKQDSEEYLKGRRKRSL